MYSQYSCDTYKAKGIWYIWTHLRRSCEPKCPRCVINSNSIVIFCIILQSKEELGTKFKHFCWNLKSFIELLLPYLQFPDSSVVDVSWCIVVVLVSSVLALGSVVEVLLGSAIMNYTWSRLIHCDPWNDHCISLQTPLGDVYLGK